MLDDKIYNIKERNDWQADKVAKRKAVLEAQKEQKRNQLMEKEKIEMSPLKGGNTASLRTFNASSSHDAAGFRKSMTSSAKLWTFNGEASPSKIDAIDKQHAATIDSKLMQVEQRME